MSRWVAAWNRFWFAASDPHPIAAFRIMLGAYLVIYLGAFAPHAVAVFSDVGVYVPYGLVGAAPSSLVAIGLFSATLVLAMLLTIGYRTRLVAPLLLLGFLYHYFLSFAVKDSSYDRLIIVYIVVLCCVDAGRAWSLDAKSGRAPATQFQSGPNTFSAFRLSHSTSALDCGSSCILPGVRARSSKRPCRECGQRL